MAGNQIETKPGKLMAKRKRKPNKIQVIDYEACWKEYLSLIYQTCLMAERAGKTEIIERSKPLLKTLKDIEKKHTSFQTIQ
jgi:hypothetical protein